MKSRILTLIQRIRVWRRRRLDTRGRISRLECEVDLLQKRMEVMAVFYEKRLDYVCNNFLDLENRLNSNEEKT